MNGKFLTDLDVRKTGTNKWKLLSDLVYETEEGTVITVPSGFITDLASIPRVFYIAMPPVGAYDWAAVVHDYLYTVQTYPKAFADSTFREAMKASGVSLYVRTKMYLAVKFGGNCIWKKHTKELNESK